MSPKSKVIQLTHPVAGNGILAEHCLALCEDGSIWRFMPDNELARQWTLLFEPYNPPSRKEGWHVPRDY